MTVAELIEQLRNYPADMRVLTLGYEGGFDNPLVTPSHAILDTNWDSEKQKKHKPWYGRHDWDSEEEKIAVPVVVVGR
mgnify:CR=1 FL=1